MYVRVMQTEEASAKLRQVITPVASQFSTVLTPLKSAVSSKQIRIGIVACTAAY